MKTPRLLWLGLVALAVAAPRGAAACSVCLAGDPSFSANGTQSQAAGSVSAYLEVRGWEKESGRRPNDHEQVEEGAPAAESDDEQSLEKHQSRRADLYVAWTPLDRVTLTLDVPWTANDITEIGADDRTHSELAGFGDVSVAASGIVWRNRPALPSTWIELRGWLKTPTGRDEQRVDGEQEPHIQTGTGSWDFGFGAAGVHRFEWGSLYASAFQRFNTEGGLHYEYGDVTLATLAVEAPLGHITGRHTLDRFTPGLALDFRYAARDHQNGSGVEDTGGSVPYLTPSLRIALPAFGESRAWLRTGVQIPLTDAWLYGRQDEGTVWSVGVGYSF